MQRLRLCNNNRPDMYAGLSRTQGEAASRTVVVGAASVSPVDLGGGERVGFDAWSTLIFAGWVPQDGYSAGVGRSSNVERDPNVQLRIAQ